MIKLDWTPAYTVQKNNVYIVCILKHIQYYSIWIYMECFLQRPFSPVFHLLKQSNQQVGNWMQLNYVWKSGSGYV